MEVASTLGENAEASAAFSLSHASIKIDQAIQNGFAASKSAVHRDIPMS